MNPSQLLRVLVAASPQPKPTPGKPKPVPLPGYPIRQGLDEPTIWKGKPQSALLASLLGLRR